MKTPINKNESTPRGRLTSLLIKIGLVLAVGVLYAAFVKLTGLGIPCPIYLITKKYCPGCGISRMFMDLLRLDFASAAGHNLLLFCLLPVGVGVFIYRSVLYVKHGEAEMSRGESVIYMIAFVLCVAFWIMRNTAKFAFLAP